MDKIPCIADVESGKVFEAKKKKPENFNEPCKKWWKERGFSIDKCEWKIPIPGKFRRMVKHDLFGLADFAAVLPSGRGVYFIQLTTEGNAMARIRKALSSDFLIPILESGNYVMVQSFERQEEHRTKFDVVNRSIDLIPGTTEEVLVTKVAFVPGIGGFGPIEDKSKRMAVIKKPGKDDYED